MVSNRLRATGREERTPHGRSQDKKMLTRVRVGRTWSGSAGHEPGTGMYWRARLTSFLSACAAGFGSNTRRWVASLQESGVGLVSAGRIGRGFFFVRCGGRRPTLACILLSFSLLHPSPGVCSPRSTTTTRFPAPVTITT